MSSLADRMLDLAAECFDAPTLDALAKLRLSPKLAERVDRLARKANEGRLTSRERGEYQAYIQISELLALIQLRARQKLGLRIRGLTIKGRATAWLLDFNSVLSSPSPL